MEHPTRYQLNTDQKFRIYPPIHSDTIAFPITKYEIRITNYEWPEESRNGDIYALISFFFEIEPGASTFYATLSISSTETDIFSINEDTSSHNKTIKKYIEDNKNRILTEVFTQRAKVVTEYSKHYEKIIEDLQEQIEQAQRIIQKQNEHKEYLQKFIG